MKAYKDKNGIFDQLRYKVAPPTNYLHHLLGKIRLFRPLENMKRFDKSCNRLTLPTFNHQELLECIKKLIMVDKDWIPNERGYSLYIRPVRNIKNRCLNHFNNVDSDRHSTNIRSWSFK